MVSTSSRKNSKGRPKGYIDNYRPQAKTVALIDDAIRVLQEYEDYLPLTIRQIFYRLVGAYSYPKTENFYGRLSGHLVNARRAKMIPFSWIRDDNVSVMRDTWFRDRDHFMASMRKQAKVYKRDLLAGQDVYIEVWCEAAGMVPQLARVANGYSIEVYSTSGFDSLTAKKAIAERVVDIGKRAVIVHAGDFDPSGVSLYEVVAEDVARFVEADRRLATVNVEFQRVALTRDQVEEHDLPTAPPKDTDSRSASWNDGGTCQLEALAPDLLQTYLGEMLTGLLDLDQLHYDRVLEITDRQWLARALPAPSDG